MKKIFSGILIYCFVFGFIAGCSPAGTKGDNRIVAEVNNYRMTVEDLQYELESIPYDDKNLLKTKEGQREYINRLLEKEILLQEAQRQGLDRERDFMKSIENYWEQALLKFLLQKKSKEISSLVHVYDNEIEEYYRNSGETSPLSKVRRDIRRTIRQKKETEAMDAWLEELRKQSYIKIDDEVLEKVFSSQ